MRSIPRFLSRPQHDGGAYTLLSFVDAFLLNDVLSLHIRVTSVKLSILPHRDKSLLRSEACIFGGLSDTLLALLSAT